LSFFEDDDSGIVTATREITVEHCRDETGIACEQSGILFEAPLGADTVAVQDEHRLRVPWMREL